MAESQREAISLALHSTKLNATNSLFREDPSLVFSIVKEARDQSLLARETLGTRLSSLLFKRTKERVFGSASNGDWASDPLSSKRINSTPLEGSFEVKSPLQSKQQSYDIAIVLLYISQ